ncbi:hypothetical protein GCM10022226_07360 [Sphaerisporangium flaviroseum]|uniref:WXG100 family type VII secretion target n=2 Tax=Sphaerisporangium flaviroseum TaxID=509199 RepID=A0ABP7HK56_9ACTN
MVLVGRELRVDEAALTSAARGMREAAHLFGGHTDALLTSITGGGGGRSPWGDGMIGVAMDRINEMLGQACRHLHTNLDQTGISFAAMRDRHTAGEAASVAAMQNVFSVNDPEPGPAASGSVT